MATPSSLMKLGGRTVLISARRSLASAAAAQEQKVAKRPPRPVVESGSYVMNLFRGRLVPQACFPYPDVLNDDQREMLHMILGPTEKFFEEVNDPAANDANETIPKEVYEQFAALGAFGAVVPPEYEGAGMNNTQMARLAEIVGANDLALGVVMGAHQSIGYKGILLYGSEEQKKKYLPDLATGRKFAAFALTEPTAGSDANSIKTKAELSPDGQHYILNGSKMWISNGGFAEVFTVFAQTQVKTPSGETKQKVSAFIVERAFGGLSHGPPEKKMGIKGSNTAEIFLENVKVPKENLLGEEGEGFKVAVNILNNGRFGIPAAMTGTITHCIKMAVDFAAQRYQFGRKLKDFGDIQEKIAVMAMKHYVNESMTYMLSGLMDSGVVDYQLEAAIGKIICSENAWQACDETIQIYGGMGFMKEPGLERIQRDLRIFRIFEGTNDILRLFIALTGLQYAGGHLREVQKALKSPTSNVGALFEFAGKRVSRTVGLASGPSFGDHVHSSLADAASSTSKCMDTFGATVEYMLMKHGKGVIDQQNQLRRLAEAAIEIYSQVCVLSRCTRSLQHNLPSANSEQLMTKTFVRQSTERALLQLAHIRSPSHNEDWQNMSKIAAEIFEHGGKIVHHPLD